MLDCYGNEVNPGDEVIWDCGGGVGRVEIINEDFYALDYMTQQIVPLSRIKFALLGSTTIGELFSAGGK